ncbi:tRNA (guanine-N(7)-)-methyltransferase subunit WDR4 [Tetrabaena socialis]|uniref:tRNA (Guanine-N(7)-)-methyltransferase subunit WDR4 n=1 Tax=Tetrabaena socialis TaxID=47790 RepID=A0A2J7ZL44_9CHLO|nr:tRNA (guanine-N(7)-)-methyltransferase subunit WDR4 [Tetrabaena socialis]|eukprot:PNH00970.1 tRNA (guanine-N(7)-)-methyltransferase subunit WDR4 [Tetrabaena socialis]
MAQVAGHMRFAVPLVKRDKRPQTASTASLFQPPLLHTAKTGQEVKLSLPAPPPAAATAAATAAASEPQPPPPHAGAMRVLAFGPDGGCLLTGGDDKLARLWRPSPAAAAAGSGAGVAAEWGCANAWRTPKKMSAGGFSLGGGHALFADKFGDVLVGRVAAAAAPAEVAAGKAAAVPATLLGHFCSIVTGLAATPCGRFLATSDKDYKIRISLLPADLLQGSYEIQAYCLGHQDFVSCIAFAVQGRSESGEAEPSAAPAADADAVAARSVLLSGSGDGTVRMWDYVSGRQLASYVAAAPAQSSAEAAGAEGDAAGSGAGGEEGDDEGDEAEGEEGAAPARRTCVSCDSLRQRRKKNSALCSRPIWAKYFARFL